MRFYLNYFLIVSFLFLVSCNDDFKVDTSPKGDFELLFRYLKHDYAYRNYHEFTMEDLRQKYLTQIKNNPTQEILADIFLNIILNELKDPHVYFINTPEVEQLSDVKEENPPDLDESVPFFEEINEFNSDHFYTYGTVKANPKIGYIYINNFNFETGGTASLGIEPGVKAIKDIVRSFNSQNIESMIIDIRSSAGGSSFVPRFIAQHFIDKKALYMVEKYPVGQDFKTQEWFVEPNGEVGFRTGKIILISNGLTCSGGEMFILAMLQRDNLVHIGSRSLGCAGNIVDKDFANGWNVRLTNSRTEHPDGKSYFKVGIIPTIIIENEDSYGRTTFNDKVLERAVKELN